LLKGLAKRADLLNSESVKDALTRTDWSEAAAGRLGNPRLSSIGFRTLCLYKATMEYHRAKDTLHVPQLLGQKSIKNTLVYTHLVDFGSREYVCKMAKTVGDTKNLIEDGFEHVTDIEDIKLFRKRKSRARFAGARIPRQIILTCSRGFLRRGL
jgi:hypothetical protein